MEEHYFDHCIDRDRDPHVKETTKIAEITDNFGKLRFKVILTDTVKCQEFKYLVEVQSFCYRHFPQVILKEYQKCFHEAICFYNTCVKQYKDLAIAETKHFQDISVYADKIGYHKIDPDCCNTCRWSKLKHSCIHDLKLACTNHKLFKLKGCTTEIIIEPIVHHNGICKYFERKCK